MVSEFCSKKTIPTASAKRVLIINKNEHIIHKCSDFHALPALEQFSFSKTAKF